MVCILISTCWNTSLTHNLESHECNKIVVDCEEYLPGHHDMYFQSSTHVIISFTCMYSVHSVKTIDTNVQINMNANVVLCYCTEVFIVIGRQLAVIIWKFTCLYVTMYTVTTIRSLESSLRFRGSHMTRGTHLFRSGWHLTFKQCYAPPFPITQSTL